MKMNFNMKEKIFNAIDWSKEVAKIVKKELKSYFTSSTAYIVMAVFLAVLEFLYFSSLMNIKMVYIEPLIEYIPWMFLFLVPAVTMSSISQERKEGTVEFYLTQPISELQFLVGKFLSSYIFIVFTVLLTLPAVFSVASFGTVDWGQIFGQYLGVLSLAFVLTAIGTYTSSIVKNQISAFLLSALISFGLTIISSEIVTQSLPVSIARLFERIGVYAHYEALSRGALDFRDIIYFLAIGSIFLIASYIPLVANKFHKKEPIYNTLKAIVILLIAFAASVAFLGEQIPGRIDLTANKLYTLSDTTKDIIGNVNDIINITVYTSTNLPSTYQPQAKDVKELLNDYETYGKGKVAVTYKYTDKDSKVETEAQTAGVQPVQFNTQEQNELSVSKGYLGIVISYLEDSEVISFVDKTDDLEYQLTKLISKLTVENKPVVVFWESKVLHSTSSSDYTKLYENLSDQFDVQTFTYGDEKKSLPENTKLLVIAGPNEEFTAEEKAVITTYLDNGGSALVLVDPVSVDLQMLSASVNSYSLSDVFEKYGMTAKSEMVYDLTYGEIVNVGGSYLLQYPFWLKAQPSATSALTKGLDTIGARWASYIDLKEGDGYTLEKLITTSKYAATQSDGTFDISLEANLSPDKSNLYARTIAASYSKDLGENKYQRIVLIADSDILSDSNIESSNSNLVFGMNAVEWLTQATSLNEIRQKNRDLSALVFENDWQSTTLQYGNIVGIIVVIAGVGIFVSARRKKKSQKLFEEID